MSDFGDATADDVATADDDIVDWSHVDELARQIEQIDAIADADARLLAARKWAAELGR